MRRIAVPVLIALVFIWVVENVVGWWALLTPWRTLDSPGMLAGPLALFFLSYSLRAWRIDRYFRLHRFAPCLRTLLQHNAMVSLLPMRAGEAAFPMLMKRQFAMPLDRSLPGLLWLRALDAHALGLGIIVAFAVVVEMPVLVLGAFVWGTLPFLALSLCAPLSKRIARSTSRAAGMTRSVIAAVPGTPGAIAEDWMLTAGNWVVRLVAFAWVIDIFVVEDYREAFVGAVAGEAVAIVPISGFAGFGTYEAGVVAGMRSIGVSAESALRGAVNLHLLTLGMAVTLAAIASVVPQRYTRRDVDRAAAAEIRSLGQGSYPP